jgi:kynurenine formamidase
MKVFDLTMLISPDTPVFPGDPKPEIEQLTNFSEDGWNSKKLSFPSHFGTHIDAPYHMTEDGKKLEQFPPESFFGTGVVLNAKAPDLELVEKGDIVFFFTDPKKEFVGEPSLSIETTQALVRKKVKMIGLDSSSPDVSPFHVHKILFENNILLVENLVNLRQLLGKRCTFYVLPLKIKDSDGAPCRAIAII